MKIQIFHLLLFLYITNAIGQNNIIFSGNISKNTTWNYDTVFINGNVLVQDSFKLMITLGTKIIPLGYI
jgi:hypothetical protein